MAHVHNLVQALSHYRHDFLNDIQLIKSYIALGKVEKVEAVLENVVYRAEQESRLSRLRMDAFAEKLLTYNWRSPKVPIEIEVNIESDNWSAVQHTAASIFTQFTQMIETETELGDEQQILVILQQTDSKELAMEYTGSKVSESMKKKTECFLNDLTHLLEAEITDSSVYFRKALLPEEKREE